MLETLFLSQIFLHETENITLTQNVCTIWPTCLCMKLDSVQGMCGDFFVEQ